MKYSCEIDINVPRDGVIDYFDDADNLAKWQDGLVSFEHISGAAGQVGAKSKLVYKMGKRDIEMIETITERSLPERIAGTYETDGMHNVLVNFFSEHDPQTTRWRVETEFTSDKLMMKLMMLLMPGAFKKQTTQFMQKFKAFAETEYARQNQ